MKRKIFRAVSVAGVLAVLVCLLCVVAGAEGTSVDVQGTLTSSFSDIIDDILSTIVAILPLCLSILGVTVSIGAAINFFKKLSGKTAK